MTDRPRADLDCRDLVEMVTAYLEGDLPPGQHESVRAHLAECTACADYVEQMRITVGLVARLRDDDLPAELRWRLREAYRNA